MSETQHKKKNKKKKKSGKKPTTEVNSSSEAKSICENNTENGTFSINKILPQEVGMTTVFKDVEVTLTHSADANGIVKESSKKKKKKKKKSKQISTEVVQETNSSEVDNHNNYIKFNEDHIELVNHPEISVTLSKNIDNPVKELSKTKEKVSISSDQKEQPEASVSSSTSKKKKKKKKKKKDTVDNNSLPPEPTPESSEISSKSPTYMKVPVDTDSCVLVVTHESFSNNNNSAASSETTTTNNNPTVLIRNKERFEDSKGIALLNPKILPEPSVSIFPVVSNQNKPSEKIDNINMDSNLQKVNELVKKDINTNDPSDQTENITTNIEGSSLSKAQLKAERRAKQEAQRAAKLAKKNENNASNIEAAVKTSSEIKEKGKISSEIKEKEKTSSETKEKEKTSSETKEKDKTPEKNILEKDESTENKSVSKIISGKVTRKFQIFSHLPPFKDVSELLENVNWKIHPAIIELGFHYNKGILCGSNSRCVGFLAAFRDVVRDYKTPPNKEFSRDLESKLKMYLDFLNSCRPLSASITSAVRFLKYQINHIPKDMSEEEAKKNLCISINNFVREEILLAKEAICISASAKIVNGDNILVFAYSSLVKDVLCKAHDQDKSFHVTVVDDGPKFEGQEMLRRLLKHGIQCSYTSIHAVSCVMKNISKVIFGAHALLLNGSVMSRLGCKQIALVASSYSVPIFVCCETYKFCDRALSDSFVHNELGRPEDLIETRLNKNGCLKNWKSLPLLQMYNILYDVTPSDFISFVVTEKGFFPCDSVAVVLRVRYASLQG
ncbi:translation initiation factor eIF-2B subunit delta [Caerostris extrusa]|uniref:Translation initiation factor eIF2B subunit delta n=1 Tax=Caerostris extrusa TaxID=172846 RepID=A0AAV4RUH6_CAEEX|nr:translation initiation factor eIF-2B subunit delta [Caerostris extrusa]